jgi:hypothetical protein
MKSYTHDELKVFWADYSQKKCMRILKDGSWLIVPMNTQRQMHIAGTKAEIVPLKLVKTFPEYLEEL